MAYSTNPGAAGAAAVYDPQKAMEEQLAQYGAAPSALPGHVFGQSSLLWNDPNQWKPRDMTGSVRGPDMAASSGAAKGLTMPYLNLNPYGGYSSTQGPSRYTSPGGPVGSAGTIPGAPARAYDPAYGGIPQVADPLLSAGQGITGNIGNLAGLYGLTTGTSGASAAGAAAQYGANLPGYTGLTEQASQNIMGDLRGQVSPDVVNMLAQTAAQRGIGFGAGAPNTNAALLAALGKTSMGLQAQGQQELTAAIGRTPVGPMFNPASMLVSPDAVQQARQAANLYGAAPVPSAAAAAAINAARSGVGAGAGARGGYSAPSYSNQSNFGGYGGGGGGVFQSGGTGMYYGGQLYQPGTSPDTTGGVATGGARPFDWSNPTVQGATEDPFGFGAGYGQDEGYFDFLDQLQGSDVTDAGGS